MHGRTAVAPGEVAHDLGEPAELLRREVAADHLDLDGGEALLALRAHVRLAEALERAAVAVGARVGRGHRRRAGLLVVHEQQRLRIEVALGDPVALSSSSTCERSSSMPYLSTNTLMRARARLTRSQSWRSKTRNTASAHLRYSPSSARTKSLSVGRHAGHDRSAAADPHLEAAHAVPDARDVRHVVDAGDRPVLVGGGEGGLHLARHQLRGGVAHEVAHVGAHVGRGVEELALADAGPRVAGHVADGVAAALARGEVGLAEHPDRLGGVAQRDVVELDVLARGDVPLVQGRPALHHVGEGLHLLGRDAPERQLDPDHLDVGLALAVHALPEAELDEVVLRGVAREVLLRLVVEVVELVLQDRDHVPRHVLVDLRIVERALAAVALCGVLGLSRYRFHRVGVLRRRVVAGPQKLAKPDPVSAISGFGWHAARRTG